MFFCEMLKRLRGCCERDVVAGRDAAHAETLRTGQLVGGELLARHRVAAGGALFREAIESAADDVRDARCERRLPACRARGESAEAALAVDVVAAGGLHGVRGEFEADGTLTFCLGHLQLYKL